MKLNKILCLGFDGSELEDSYWQQINELTHSRVLVSDEAEIAEDRDADILLVKLGSSVQKNLIDKLPNLKYIGMLGTGYGGIDTSYASKRGVVVANIADYATEAVAEFTFGMLLEYYRELTEARTRVKNENYSDESFNGKEIRGKTFGVIGLGDIGTRTAELAQAFGAKVQYWSHNRKQHIEQAGGGLILY